MITKPNARSAVWWSLAAAWAAVIFFFSAQDAASSAALSNAVTEFLLTIFRFDVSASAPAPNFSWGDLIRSLAHFACFAVLGVLTSLAVRSHRPIERRCVWIPFAICFGYAVADEIHQRFVPGRSMQLVDILVDSLGAALGILAVTLIALLVHQQKKKNHSVSGSF